MAAASQAVISTPNGCVFASPKLSNGLCGANCNFYGRRHRRFVSVVRASSDESDCNAEECAPDKEVGKISVEWLAEERTRVVGTYPPRRRGWTGYVEKDTAGQTNIYSVEPAIYVAESAISSGNAGSSSDGAENSAAIAAGVALISIAAASSILLQVGKSPPGTRTVEYSGPSLSYYINKFKSSSVIQASAELSQTEAPPLAQSSESSIPEGQAVQVPSEVQAVEVSSENQPFSSSDNVS